MLLKRKSSPTVCPLSKETNWGVFKVYTLNRIKRDATNHIIQSFNTILMTTELWRWSQKLFSSV